MTTTTALCATLLPTTGDLWFSPDPARRIEARRICARCPLLYTCADTGLAQPDTYGVWGGLDAGDRDRYRGVDRPNPDDYQVPPARPVERTACGTEGAFLAHRQRGEACDVCEVEHDARVEAGRRARLAGLHGTDAGHRLHRLLGEPPCRRCHNAAIQKRAADKARRRQEGRAAWARRGGLPETPTAVLRAQGAAA